MTRIKFCGIKESTDISVISEIKPEYIGFVFWSKSKRNVSTEEALSIGKRLSPGIKKVGVFVDENINTVAGLLDEGVIDIAQLHGNESEDYILELKRRTGNGIIKAFKIKSEDDLEDALKSSADMVLLDAGMGDGKTLDWKILEGFKRSYILAGGLAPANVREAIEKLHPYGVDVSSGIEKDGIKDVSMMNAFAEAVRREK